MAGLIDFSTPGLLDRAGQLKGTDFVHFYAIGSLAGSGSVSGLYDPAIGEAASVRLVPESRGVSYLAVYGPQVYLLFAPLASLPYGWALLVWTLVSGLTYGVCCALVWRLCPSLRHDGPIVAVVAAASPAFFNLVMHGQTSALALACFTAAFFGLRNQRPFAAGLALGVLIYKPQLGIAAAAVCALAFEWRVIAGGIVGAAAQLGAAWMYFGTGVMLSYLDVLRGIGDTTRFLEPKPYQMHSLRAFWNLLIPWPNLSLTLYVLSAAAIVGLAAAAWRSGAALTLRYSLLLLATVLVSPHLNVYDLVILAPALLMLTDWALRHAGNPMSTPVRRLLYLSYALPLVGVAAQFTRVQGSVLAMAALSATVAVVALQETASAGRRDFAAPAPDPQTSALSPT